MHGKKQILGVVISVFIIFMLIGCGQQKAAIEKQKELTRGVIDELWNKRNLNVLDELFSADFINHRSSGDNNLESYKKAWVEFRDAYPEQKFDIDNMVAEGDKVIVLATSKVTDKTGKQLSGRGWLMFRWKEGKIIELSEMHDELGYRQQLGYKLTPPITETTFARVTITQMKPEKIADAVKIYGESVVPDAKNQKGFRGIFLLSDFKTGKGLSIAIWDSEADAIANEQSGYYKAQVDKFKDLFTAKPVREGYVVTVQE